MRDTPWTSGLLPLGLALVMTLPAPAPAMQAPGGPPSNLSVLDSLSASCFDTVSEIPERMLLETDANAAFLRPALLGFLLSHETEVFVDPPSGPGIRRILFSLDGSRIDYRRAGRQFIRREVGIDLRVLQRDEEGRVLREDLCRRTFTDIVPERALDDIETATNPASQGRRPPAGVRSRLLEPALLTTAVGTIVYLFFAIRSRTGE